MGKVYLTLTFLVAIAALGSYIQILTQFEAAPLFMIVGFVILLYLYLFSSYDETKSQKVSQLNTATNKCLVATCWFVFIRIFGRNEYWTFN